VDNSHVGQLCAETADANPFPVMATPWYVRSSGTRPLTSRFGGGRMICPALCSLSYTIRCCRPLGSAFRTIVARVCPV
jgi:hypothetical protein